MEARVHDRARGHAARANDAGARSRAADPGDRRRSAMVRPEGRHPGAERLRGGPRRVLAAPVLDFPRDRERGRGLVELEVNRRLRRAKADALDVRKLLGMLLRYHAGERAVWSVVRVPTVEEEDRRQLHRELRTLKQERTRVANRMNGLLANQGLWLPPGTNIGAAARTVRLGGG